MRAKPRYVKMYLAEIKPFKITKIRVWRETKKHVWVLDWGVLHEHNCDNLREYQIITGKLYPPTKKVKKVKNNSAFFHGEEDAKKWILQKLQTFIDNEAKILSNLKKQKSKISRMSCKRLLKGEGQW